VDWLSKFEDRTHETIPIFFTALYEIYFARLLMCCLQLIEILELIHVFVYMFRRYYCLLYNVKSIREVLILKDNNWNIMSFI